MAAQAHYLGQVKDAAGDLPVVCAGDIFDKWNASPELINFALEHLPTGMFCVPGQHDLPNHRMEEMHRSGYGVLRNAEKIIDLAQQSWRPHWGQIDVEFHGYGWNQPIVPPIATERGLLRLAVVHQYCWEGAHTYPGAPVEGNAASLGKLLTGYDAAVFGDNHKGFLTNHNGVNILNCGGFIRRKSDEIDYTPAMGVLYNDGTIKRRKYDTSIDSFHETEEKRSETAIDMQDFLAQLEDLGEHGLNFREMVENHLRRDDVHPSTKEIILKALETQPIKL
jgi:hypothetical protein